jgi:hypothetical protein
MYNDRVMGDPKYKGKIALDSSIGVNIAIAGVIRGWVLNVRDPVVSGAQCAAANRIVGCRRG